MKKVASGLSLLIMLIGITAHASVLGTPVDGGSQETELSVDAVYRHNEFMSSTVGKQTENYVEYTPDAEGIPMSVPVVVSGGYVYGKRDITEAAAYMRKQGMTPLMGINADVFRASGVPNNDSVINGKIISKDAPATRAAVGFRADGAGSTYPHVNDKTYDKEYPYTLSVSENASIATDEIEVTIGGVKADNSEFLKRKLGVITGGDVEFTAGIKGIPEGTTLENIECVVSVKYSLDGIPASQDYTFTLE